LPQPTRASIIAVLSNLTFMIQAATNLNPIITWTDLGTAPANSSGIVSFTDTNALSFPVRFCRGRKGANRRLTAKRMKIPITIFLRAALGAGLIAVTASTPAATLTVTSTADSGPGTLRDALAGATNGDTINFSITGRITLTTGELLVTNNVTILGRGPANLAVNGNANHRVFHVQNGAIATIASLTITNGKALGDVGGGIYNEHSTLTVSNCTLSGNSARFGGAIYNDGIGSSVGPATLSLRESTICSNSVGVAGAGIFNNGINGSATLTVTNSTFIGNSTASNGNGGAIYNDGESSGSAILTVANSTFTGNAAYFGSGGGIHNDAGTVTVSTSTLSGNLAYTLAVAGSTTTALAAARRF
jgi:hypothetical protein